MIIICCWASSIQLAAWWNEDQHLLASPGWLIPLISVDHIGSQSPVQVGLRTCPGLGDAFEWEGGHWVSAGLKKKLDNWACGSVLGFGRELLAELVLQGNLIQSFLHICTCRAKIITLVESNGIIYLSQDWNFHLNGTWSAFNLILSLTREPTRCPQSSTSERGGMHSAKEARNPKAKL